MHVDGGTTNQVFLFPTEMRMGGVDAKLGIDPVRRLYIIRNGRVAVEKDPAATGQRPVTEDSGRAWKAMTIILAVTLIVVLVGMTLIVAGVMKLGLSLL
jgi:hypothetical protein